MAYRYVFETEFQDQSFKFLQKNAGTSLYRPKGNHPRNGMSSQVQNSRMKLINGMIKRNRRRSETNGVVITSVERNELRPKVRINRADDTRISPGRREESNARRKLGKIQPGSPVRRGRFTRPIVGPLVISSVEEGNVAERSYGVQTSRG